MWQSNFEYQMANNKMSLRLLAFSLQQNSEVAELQNTYYLYQASKLFEENKLDFPY